MTIGDRNMIKHVHLMLLPACLLNLPAAGPSLAEEIKDDNGRRCINARAIQGTEVLDDLNILFFMRGRSIYHNRLPRQCTGLSRDRRFSYETATRSLCNLDRIRILRDAGGRLHEGKSCQLGYFHPIAQDDIELLIEDKPPPPQPDPRSPSEPEEIIGDSDETREPAQGPN